jgi:DNA-binding NtrC family response regulator
MQTQEMGKILLLEDDHLLSNRISTILEHSSYKVTAVYNSETFFAVLDSFSPDVILLDIVLMGSKLNGVEVLRILSTELDISAKIIVMSGAAKATQIAEIRSLGAYHFLEKGGNFNINQLLIHVENAIQLKKQEEQNFSLQIENINLKKQLIRTYPFIGESQAIRTIRQQILKLAQAEEDMFVLGETGTGKEVAVNYYYLNAPRFGKAFHTVNCSALTETLIESELFGHMKGSFTSADRNKIGFFEKCHNGILFLDEITNLSLPAQAKILRAIEYKEIQIVGGESKKVDTRLLFASNATLEKLSKPEVFRKDLFYRIEGNIIELPPLRERGNDILLLMSYFFTNYAPQYDTVDVYNLTEIADKLTAYSWPGNVRELRNFCKNILIYEKEINNKVILHNLELKSLKQDGMIDAEAQKYLRIENIRDSVAAFERDYLVYYLTKNNWMMSQTAHNIGVERTTLYKKMKAYRITPPYPNR